jgi:hypothetical protein
VSAQACFSERMKVSYTLKENCFELSCFACDRRGQEHVRDYFVIILRIFFSDLVITKWSLYFP